MNVRQDNGARWAMGLLLAGGASVTCALPGCLTVEQMAPPVGPRFSSIAMTSATRATLARGREVYLTDCARCHSVEPIDRYSMGRWRSVIERMAPLSKLDESGTAALQAYILAAHEVMETEKGKE